MKYVRFEYKGLSGEGILKEGYIYPADKEPVALKDVVLLCPVSPTKIVAVGLNYIDHAKELRMDIPKEPLIFIKPVSSIIGPEEAIRYPSASNRVDYEAELAIVIKKKAHKISADQADEYILGYTCLNDVTARDIQKRDIQWTRAKSFDTFCPIGPHIKTDLDMSSLKIELILNGRIKQSSNTKNMIFDCRKLVEFITSVMTLEEGDVIATGTPAGVGPLKTGDSVEVRIEKIGSLINNVTND